MCATPTTRRRVWAALVPLLIVAAACSGTSSSIEYKAPDDSALFRVPQDWHIYSADELTSIQNRPFVTNFGDQLAVLSEVGFDGAPGASVANLSVAVAAAEYPVGTFVVRAVGESEREAVSRSLLEQAVLWPEAFTVAEGVEEDFSFDDFEGIRRFVPFQDQDTEQQGLVYYISVTDPEDTRIFSMAAGCSRTCWEIYGDEIVEVVDSWLVNTRR
jgi:hypothetical protein